jgi:hypothetical protein
MRLEFQGFLLLGVEDPIAFTTLNPGETVLSSRRRGFRPEFQALRVVLLGNSGPD